MADHIEKAFEQMQLRLDRARENARHTHVDDNCKEIVLFELIKLNKETENFIRNYDSRFEPIRSASVHTPPLDLSRLNICDLCGQPGCTSDHK